MLQPALWLFAWSVAALSPDPVTPGPSPSSLPAQSAPADPMAEAQRVAREVQKAYEGTQDVRARFTQRFTYTLLRRTQESSGTVTFRKPGHMRWDYQSPVPKSFIVDGKSLWIHQPKDNTALVNPCFQQDGLTASVAFLWGEGNITTQFDVAPFAGRFGTPSDPHLELTPKVPNALFHKLILVVDPSSYRVKQSIVVDAQGNLNQFVFDESAFNVGVSRAEFAFEAPAGTHVSRLPGACQEGASAPAPAPAGVTPEAPRGAP